MKFRQRQKSGYRKRYRALLRAKFIQFCSDNYGIKLYCVKSNDPDSFDKLYGNTLLMTKVERT